MSTMNARDEEDDEGQVLEVPDCPFCEEGAEDCPHDVLYATKYGGDWDGPLTVATQPLEEKLLSAMAGFFGRKGQLGSDAPQALAEWVDELRRFFDGTPESLAGFTASRRYWLALAEAVGSVHEVEFDNDHPGGGETYWYVFFEEPLEDTARVVGQVLRDLEALGGGPKRRRRRAA